MWRLYCKNFEYNTSQSWKENQSREIFQMSNFVYLTDLHFGATPICRKDNYNKSILAKFEYVLKVARKNNCSVLFGGDLFDTPKIRFFDLNELIRILAKYQDVKIYGLRGNEGHDGIVDSSPLTLLKLLGLLRLDDYIDYEDCRILFAHHGQDIEVVEKDYAEGKTNILMTHRTIVKKPVVFQHTLFEDFSCKSEIITVAHYHPYQGILEYENRELQGNYHSYSNQIKKQKLYIAPGSVARRKHSKEEIDKIPKYVFLQINRKEFFAKEKDIPCEKDIWIEKSGFEIEEEILYNEILQNVNSMREVLNSDDTFPNLIDAMDFYAKKINLPQNIFQFVKGRYENV